MSNMINSKALTDRFIRYVKIDTQSDDTVSDRYPSTQKQLQLSNMLLKELKELGISDATIDEYGYVMGTVPANTDKKLPTIGFLAHVDTSPDMSGANVKPRFVEQYDGSEMVLNKDLNVTLSPKDFPELKNYIGKTLIVTDGTTLLGADDKAGVAEIMTAVEYMVNNPQFKHGPIRIGFTVDEEVGRGVDHFDVKKFKADFAYTLDGGAIGELEYENFNAAGAKITIQGRNIHPGYAKDKMVNAILVAMEFNSLLPANQRPEHTQGYEGFYHLIKMDGTVENATFQYIIRDHNREKFEALKAFITKVTEFINMKYGEGTATLEMKDQYYNMREQVEPVFHIVETAVKAMELVGVKPLVKPIRGGTDGARLSYMGLPCPNLFAGGENFHGKHEYVAVESMVKATEAMLKIIELYAKK
ncbi:MAG: peptidase T [Tenuifilaceae bacterium]|jgi:tripeptide aminopeptidase|nr:peptidase T [Bacteroidales bacterium]OQC64588.1 MAG: Peptidase T [Bacteroidetes bacterium ADurb.Bin008]HNV81375.1 peptidase T [Tenuifilaceae bacterium]HOF91784.1 peptidase T [Tenuifilaceae bacterium]HOM85174.1 peptidase T [Tenuifilaceae bacterium]